MISWKTWTFTGKTWTIMTRNYGTCVYFNNSPPKASRIDCLPIAWVVQAWHVSEVRPCTLPAHSILGSDLWFSTLGQKCFQPYVKGHEVVHYFNRTVELFKVCLMCCSLRPQRLTASLRLTQPMTPWKRPALPLTKLDNIGLMILRRLSRLSGYVSMARYRLNL